MKRKNALSILLLLPLLLIVSGCETVAKFDEAATGSGSFGGGTSSSITFSGISSIDQITDVTARLNWTSHADAAAYEIYNVTSGTTFVATVMAPATGYDLSGLNFSTVYKYRVRAKDSEGNLDSNTNDVSFTTNLAPNPPSGLALQEPTTTPNFDDTPTIRISGVKAGDTIKLFTDSSCTAQVGSAVASGTTADITTSSLAAAAYTFHANATNSGGNASNCSSATVSYTVEICPTGYITVPENTDLGVDAFCVMQYEAKCVGAACPTATPSATAVATSQAAGNPWVGINAHNALLACQAIGAGYDLISNAEWMTIARNIEADNSNWEGGVLNRGWSASNGSDGFQNSGVAPSTDNNCLYNTGANTCAATGDHKLKRTHMLTNGEEIWDFAGNVWEWTDWEVETPNTANFTLGPTGCATGWQEVQTKITGCSGQTPNLGDPLPATSILASPFDTNLSSVENIGQVFGGSGGAALRGGYWADGTGAGAFALALVYGPSSTNAGVGFRCVFRP